MRELHELLSKFNPMAEEFIPPSYTKQVVKGFNDVNSGFFTVYNGFGITAGNFPVNEDGGFRRKKSFGQQGKRRMNPRTSLAQRDEIIRRTVNVSDIDQQVTEEQLAGLFIGFGQVLKVPSLDSNLCLLASGANLLAITTSVGNNREAPLALALARSVVANSSLSSSTREEPTERPCAL